MTAAEPRVDLDAPDEAEDVAATVAELVDAITAGEAGQDTAGRSTFTTTSPQWWAHGRVFGGMVVAQALHAAMRTVGEGLEVHSLHGYFLRPTSPGSRTTHVVERLRDGRSFSTRQVTSEVQGKETFRMTCSFHVPEAGDDYQLPMAPHLPPPGDVKGSEAPFPFDVRDLGTTERRADGTFQSTRRCWMRTREQLPDDPAVHASVLAYLSDMTAASFRPHSLGVWGSHTDASLDHALWFHRPWRADVWSLFDMHALVNAGGRATIRGTMHGEDGTLHLSMAQELLIRELAEPLHIPTPSWVERDAPTGGVHGTT